MNPVVWYKAPMISHCDYPLVSELLDWAMETPDRVKASKLLRIAERMYIKRTGKGFSR